METDVAQAHKSPSTLAPMRISYKGGGKGIQRFSSTGFATAMGKPQSGTVIPVRAMSLSTEGREARLCKLTGVSIKSPGAFLSR